MLIIFHLVDNLVRNRKHTNFMN